MPKFKRGKLFIKFIHSKLTFCFKSCPEQNDYYNYLVDKSHNGFRQTPIVSLRMSAFVSLLLRKGYVFAKHNCITIPSDQAYLWPKIEHLTKNYTQLSSNIDRTVKQFKRLACDDELDIQSVKMTSPLNKGTVVIKSNGIVSATANIYNDLTAMFAQYLTDHEEA